MGNYNISSASGFKQRVGFSPFPRGTRPFTEPISSTKDDLIGDGLSLPDLIRRYYRGSVPMAFSGNYGFLSRDNKSRDYTPGTADKFVFNGNRSIQLFKDHALKLIESLTAMGRTLGLPIKDDEERKIAVIDTDKIWEQADSLPVLRSPSGRRAVAFLVGNTDIMKKACIVRGISPGWWAVSYAGKTAPSKSYFSMSLAAHEEAVRILLASPVCKQMENTLWADASDPLISNPGYPYYTAQIDDKGNPVTRIQTVELFKGIGRVTGGSWANVLDFADSKAGRFGLGGHPFAVAPLRRLQPGYKWQHQFDVGPTGMRTAYDERGLNSQRVAHMVPYVYNVLTTGCSIRYKAVRMVLPGAYHDGESKRRRTLRLKNMASAGKLFMAEADYSNFDRFMAVDLIADIISWFIPNKFWMEAMSYLHDDASLLWPDYSSLEGGTGWAFKPGKLGLLSGVKATAETGTLVNSVVNGEALARAYGWSKDKLVQYLTQYKNAPPGSLPEYYYIQSDDTQLISSSLGRLIDHGNAFKEATKNAGLKGSVEMGDRFLMRHLSDGGDLPVPARVWQNTLSNEAPPESELIFLAGLAARTDGLLGIKSVDPFGTGLTQKITGCEARFTIEVLRSIRSFIATASESSSTGLRLVDMLLDDAPTIETSDERHLLTMIEGSSAKKGELDAIRREITSKLAAQQLEEQGSAGPGSVNAWLSELLRDAQSPSTALIMDQLTQFSPLFGPMLTKLTAKDKAFFQYAASTLGAQRIH